MNLNVGVIGAGGMGSEHARNLSALPDVSVAMVADPDEAAAAAVAHELGARSTARAADLIADPEVAAVVIASPDRTHAELAVACIAADKPALCEKPLGTDTEQALRVMTAETARGSRLIQLGLMREFDPAHLQLQSQVSGLGDVKYLRATHRNRNSFSRTIDHAISQSMVHDVHTVRWLTGREITNVSASIVPRPGPAGEPDNLRCAVALCQLSDGSLATLEFDDFAFGYEVGVEVSCYRGLAVTPPQINPDLHDDWFAWFSDAYRAEARAWANAVQRNESSGPSVWDGVAAQFVIAAIQKSAATEAPVSVQLPEKPELYR